MRFDEFKPIKQLLREFSEPSNDSPAQFLKDIQTGEIDSDIAKKAMDQIQQIMSTSNQTSNDKPATQDITNDKKSVNQPQSTEPKIPGKTQTPVQQPPETPTLEALTYSKANAEQLKKLLMKQGASSQEVMDIITFAYRENIVRNCKELMSVKMYKPEGADLLSSLFYELPATFHQRNELSNILLKGGVLDLTKFNEPGMGSLLDLILPKYRANKAVINLFLKLRNRKDFPTQVSAANKGAGEDLITILGSPVQKLSPGDLNINGLEIEVKAIGARLKGFGGGGVYGNPAVYYTAWATKVLEALGKEGMMYMEENGYGLQKYFHFGLKNLQALSDALKVSKNPKKKELLVEAFDGLLQILYPMSTVSMRKKILNSFDEKGFNVETFRKNWFLFSYDYYVLTTADKKTGTKMHGILFINQGDNSYQLVTDSKQISANWENYELGSDLFNWTNPTGQAPKITYGKETRVRRKVAKP